jgi:hypothetical protein
MRGQHALGELDGVSQRNLQDPRTQLDATGHGGGDGQRCQRVREEEAATDSIERPDALESRLFDATGGFGESALPAPAHFVPLRGD